LFQVGAWALLVALNFPTHRRLAAADAGVTVTFFVLAALWFGVYVCIAVRRAVRSLHDR
jgi:hypothetical protein